MSSRPTLFLLGICAVVLGGGALYFTRPVVAPVAFALFVIALVWPMQVKLRAHMPTLAALALTLALTFLTVFALGYAIVWGLSQTGRWLIVNAGQFQEIYSEAALWLEGHGLYSAGTLAETFNVSWLIGASQHMAARLNAMIAFAVVTMIFVMLGLLEADILGAKLRLRAGALGQRVLRASAAVAAKFRIYMIVRTLMSVLTGVFVWAVAAALGLELALAFGVLAFALNYIPFIGPLVATLLPTFFALAQFGSWETAATVFVAMNVIQFFSGSYIEPRMAGRALAISPFLVLFGVFFWSFMWGLAGAFIGVPLMIAALTFCEEGDETRWIAVLFSGQEEREA